MLQRLNIKDLEHLSGIKAHTIRIWEKRYNLFDPERTATNIRSYSNEDLRKLLNVVTILDSGKRISQVCSMTDERIFNELESLQLTNSDNQTTVAISELIYATLNCNADTFEKILEDNQSRLGIEGVIEDIIYPLLRRIGLLWTVSRLKPAQEHFASQLIRQKLFSAIESLPKPSKSGQQWLLFLPQNERHEIALLYSYFLIKKAGYNVLYLGPDLPLEDAKECAQRVDATHLLCFFTIGNKSKSTLKYLGNMVHELKDYQVYYSGLSEENQSNLKENFHHLDCIYDLRKLL